MSSRCKEFEYFTFVRFSDDGKKLQLKPPVDYWVDYDKSVLTLHFTLPLETPIDPNGQGGGVRRVRPVLISSPSASPPKRR